MTGPEHYKKAEELLANSIGPDWRTRGPERFAEAQVHATLALAAAYGMSRNGEMPIADSDAWIAATTGQAASDG
jgi:hypothetical protein